jgi:hypothetical protein
MFIDPVFTASRPVGKPTCSIRYEIVYYVPLLVVP